MNLFIDSEASGNEENTLVVKKLASLIRPRYYSDLLGAGDLTMDFPPLYVFSFLISPHPPFVFSILFIFSPPPYKINKFYRPNLIFWMVLGCTTF